MGWVQSIVECTSINRMQLTFKKTWEMLLKGRSTKALPVPLVSIERKPTQLFSPIRVTGIYIWIIFYRKLVVVCTSDVFVNSMDCRWIIFIFFLLVLSYLYLHMLWKYGAARIIISTQIAWTGCSRELLSLTTVKNFFN